MAARGSKGLTGLLYGLCMVLLQLTTPLVNALGSGFGELTKEQITAAVTSCGLDERVRGEALTVAQFAAVSDAIARTKKLC